MMEKSLSILKQVLESPLGNLTQIPRFSGTYMHQRETVSDHVWGLVSLGLQLIPYLNLEAKKPIDLKEFLYRCIVHDLDEAGSIDIPRPFKYYSEKLKNLLDKTAIQILKDRGVSVLLLKDISSAKDFATQEGTLLKILDTIQPGLVMIHEIQLGNSLIKSELKNICEGCEYYLEVLTYPDLCLDKSISNKLTKFLLEFISYMNEFK